MPFDDIADYTKMVLSYLREDKLISPLPKGFHCIPLMTNKTKLVCEVIQENWKTLTFERKLEIVRAVDNAIIECKQKHNERIMELKKALVGENAVNWKDFLLGVSHEKLQDRRYDAITFDADASREYRAQFKPVSQQNTYSIIGSCFKTNIQRHLKNNTGEGHCLDALYVSRTANDHSYTFAIGDGSDGHTGDSNQDKTIARAGHFACKHAARLLNTLPTPNLFDTQYKIMVRSIEQEVRAKAKLEGTTLLTGRAFPWQGRYRCVGFNIGDSMCIGYDPKTNECFPVAPARVISEGTAIFPTVYKEFEIHPFDIILPADTILLMISDGVYDHLPCIQALKKYPNEKEYRETLIDANFIISVFKLLPPDSKPEAYAETLRQAVMDTMEQLRREKMVESEKNRAKYDEAVQQEKIIDPSNKEEQRLARGKIDALGEKIGIQIGDDMAICVISLPPLPRVEQNNNLRSSPH